jgi:5,10-methenyltetrahydromethanopterin hydrogenase
VVSHEAPQEFIVVTTDEKDEAVEADNFEQSQSVMAKEGVSDADEATELNEVPESIKSVESTEITEMSEVTEGHAEQKHDADVRQYLFSDDDALPAEKAHEVVAKEKEPEASSDKGHKTVSKPRQYNLGDYL